MSRARTRATRHCELVRHGAGLTHGKSEFVYIEKVLKASYDELFVTDGQGTIIFVNEACERLYGLKPGDMLGRNVLDLEREGVFKPSTTRRVLSERRRVTVLQTTQIGKTVIVTSNPVLDDAGNVELIVSNVRDVTEILQLKQQLLELETMVEAYKWELEELRAKEVRAEGLVVRSEAMQHVVKLASKVAGTNATVFITGESGVGKDVLARYIHSNSPRRDGPFIKINCGAIPENLLESELFGYEPGAFTGAQKSGKPGLIELSHQGTIFLDEVSELPLHLQVKLLQVIQDRQVRRVGGTKLRDIDMRVVAATNRDIEQAVGQGRFREDLYYRLNVVRIHIPPLRDRKEDILPLCLHFLEEFCGKYGVRKRFSPEALDNLISYDWPGNVRELQNVIESAIVTSERSLIAADDLPPRVRRSINGRGTLVVVSGIIPLSQARAELERQLYVAAYRTYGSTRKAARALGVDQSTVVRKLREIVGRGKEASERNGEN